MAGREHLKIEILLVLSCSRNKNCLSKSDLQSQVKRNVKFERDEFEEALEELCKNKEVEQKVKNKERVYCLTSRFTFPTPALKIAKAASEATTPLSTKELAEEVNMPHAQVYHICRRLEEKEYFTSDLMQRKKLVFFAELIGEVVHAGNYEQINLLYRELRRIIAEFRLGDPRLKQSLQEFFRALLRKEEYAKYRKSINSFRKRLLSAVARAKKKSDLNEFLGLRSFYPKVRVWESCV